MSVVARLAAKGKRTDYLVHVHKAWFSIRGRYVSVVTNSVPDGERLAARREDAPVVEGSTHSSVIHDLSKGTPACVPC